MERSCAWGEGVNKGKVKTRGNLFKIYSRAYPFVLKYVAGLVCTR